MVRTTLLPSAKSVALRPAAREIFTPLAPEVRMLCFTCPAAGVPLAITVSPPVMPLVRPRASVKDFTLAPLADTA